MADALSILSATATTANQVDNIAALLPATTSTPSTSAVAAPQPAGALSKDSKTPPTVVQKQLQQFGLLTRSIPDRFNKDSNSSKTGATDLMTKQLEAGLLAAAQAPHEGRHAIAELFMTVLQQTGNVEFRERFLAEALAISEEVEKLNYLTTIPEPEPPTTAVLAPNMDAVKPAVPKKKRVPKDPNDPKHLVQRWPNGARKQKSEGASSPASVADALAEAASADFVAPALPASPSASEPAEEEETTTPSGLKRKRMADSPGRLSSDSAETQSDSDGMAA